MKSQTRVTSLIRTLYRACVVVLLALSISHGVSAQSQAKDKTAESSLANGGADADDALKMEQRRLTLERAHSLSDQFLKFKDEGVKALSLARLGDILWKDDEPFARKMFLKALDLATPDQLYRQRRSIIMMLAKHDAVFARRVIDQDFAGKPAGPDQVSLNAAVSRSLVDDNSQHAMEFAKRSLSGGLSPMLLDTVKMLRRKDPAAADQLFLAMLAKATDGEGVDPQVFMNLGSYLFTSPKIDPSDDNRMLLTGVGTVIVTDLTADRPNVPPALVHAYLQTALSLLSRPTSDQRQKNLYYALGRILLPKTTRFAPELADAMANALQSIAAGVAPALTQESSYENLYRTTPRDSDEALTEIEKNPSAKYRDASYLGWVFDLCRKGEFNRARKVNEKISDHDLQVQLSMLISFTEGARLTERDQAALVEAKSIAQKLPQGIERAVLFLGIAEKSFVLGDNQGGLGAINETVKAAESVYDARRPFLLLNAAGQLAPVDPLRAEQLLKEAVRSFNSQDQTLLSRVEWRERVDSPPTWRDFALDVKGVYYSFEHNLAPLFRADPGYTINTISGLSDEKLRAGALLGTISATLRYGSTQAESSGSGHVRLRQLSISGMSSARGRLMQALPEWPAQKEDQGPILEFRNHSHTLCCHN